MSGEIAHLLGLIGGYATGTEPDGTLPPFAFIESSTFALWTDTQAPPVDSTMAVRDWFAGLRLRGVDRLLLAIPGVNAFGELPPRKQIGFINTAGWFLVAAGPNGERWRAVWEVGDRTAADRRIWRIAMQGVAAGHPIATDGGPMLSFAPTVEGATDQLVTALQRAHQFATRTGLEPWPDWFRRALGIVTSDPDAPPSPQRQPTDLPLASRWQTPAARRLLRAAYASFVFGGMGTWNDVAPAPDDDAEYEWVSYELFGALLAAFVAGANAR